jgi:hypothetical protein
MIKSSALLLGAAVLVTGCSTAAHSASATAHGYEPVLHAGEFTTKITNPWFPLPPGRVWTYRGFKDGKAQTDVVKVTTRTRVIDGIRALGVSDISYLRGKPQETTTDWYAQDRQGNVWYLGEDTAEGTDTSGTWAAGVKDGEPGIIMPARPAVPMGYRQEFSLAGGADDIAWTVAVNGKTLTTLEWSALEPGVVDRKTYGWKVGIVSELAMSGPQEVWQLTGTGAHG